MPIDIIIYAIIAAGLFFWLQNMLGETHGEERDRPNIVDELEKHVKQKEAEKEAKKKAAEDQDDHIENVTPIDEMPSPISQMQMGSVTSKTSQALDADILDDLNDKGIEKELFKIAQNDRNFQLKDFIENAKDAFVMIIEAYSEGDRETLEDMLAQKVYEPFIEAIEDRESRGETVDVDVHAVKDAKIRKAWTDGKMSYIAIRFVAMETLVITNKDGEVLSGNPDTVSEKIDVWTFGRNTKTSDPRWFLYETDMDDGVAFQGEHKVGDKSDDQPSASV
jgi:predicted lipid-binding transport protein (Tim44 family)